MKHSLKNTIKNMYTRKNSLDSFESSSLKNILRKVTKCWVKYKKEKKKTMEG